MKNKYLLGISVGIILLIATMILNVIFEMALPGLKAEYETSLFRPWEDPIMSLFFLYPIVLGMFLACLWTRTRKSWESGLKFGVFIGLFLSIPMFIVNYSSFNLSALMIGSWAVMGFLNSVIAGLALEKLEG